MKYVPRLLPYLRPYWKLATLSVAVLTLSSLFTLLTPWPLTILVDNVLSNKPLPPLLASGIGGLAASRSHLLIMAISAGLVITLLSGGLDVLSNYLNTTINQRIVFAFRSDLLQQTQRLSVPFADQISTGRLMYAINFEAVASGGVIMAIEPLAQGAFTIVGMVAVAFRIDPLLALLSILVVPPLYSSVGYYAKHIQPRLLHVKQMEADSLSIIHDALSMLRVAVAFVREAYEVHRFRKQGERTVQARVDVTVRQAGFGLAVSVITAIGNTLVLGFGALHVIQGQLTTGQLLVILSYIAAVYKPLQAISTTIGSLQDQFVGLEMGFHVLDTQPAVDDGPDATVMNRAQGHVVFEGVHFKYPGREETLKDISFEAQAGQVLGLVGPTGAGKTTLASLLVRFYDPSAGRILLDGVDIRQLTLSSLRGQISLVPQEPLLFSGTIRENIGYGCLEADIDQIVEAARAANAHDFIMRLPEQYETPVGEKGVRLSGGERQRICVARAFLKDAPILVLDEPTASIDSRTEAVILDALERLMAGRTTFMIAHRLSTIRSADLILVMDHGELVEQGRPDELLRRDGLYKQLHEAQLGPRPKTLVAEAPSLLYPAPPTTNGEPEPQGVSVEWLGHRIPAQMQASREHFTPVTLRNSGARVWPATNGSRDPGVAISYHWRSNDGSEVVVWDGRRTDLPYDIRPGATCTAENVVVIAPDDPGNYRLEFSLVQESVAWFEHLGAATLTVPVCVREMGALTASDLPGSEPEERSNITELPALGHKPQIVLLGMMAKMPVAGVVWQTLHYLIGFRRLGCGVTYAEAHAGNPAMFPNSQAAAGFIAQIMRRFDLGSHWCFHARHDDGRHYGLTESQLQERYSSADLIINLHGGTSLLPEHRCAGRLVYLETDPVAMEVQLYHNNQEAIDFLARHDVFLTFGENYGNLRCRLPVSDRFDFKPTRQPVVMELWQPSADGCRDVLTTVGSWNQTERRRDVQIGDQAYTWSKHHEFLKFLDLPRRTDQPFELALARCEEADKSLLQSHGWQVRDALSFSLNPDAYRRYISESRGEFTVAKDQNIRLRSGWFSDRSATYLAAGRPAINQDTGFGDFLPTGEGLFSFSTIEDVLRALDSITANYERQRRAAHELAQEYFNSDVVLSRLLEDAGQ